MRLRKKQTKFKKKKKIKFLYSSLIYADNLDNCNAHFSGIVNSVQHLQAYANEQITKSYEYLLLAANFGNYVKNRPGFEKQFRELSDTAFNRGINLIKHITKRGGSHNFNTDFKSTISTQSRTLELNELKSLAFALDTEKELASKAHNLHKHYSHANHKSHSASEANNLKANVQPISEPDLHEHELLDKQQTHYDPEVAHYLEEKFIEDQANKVRQLSGFVNDLKHLLEKSSDASLSVYLFDEYLQKA